MGFGLTLKKQLQAEYAKKDRGGAYGLTQRILAYNSNRIEGSTLTEKQTASIFETGTLSGDGMDFRTKDIEEMTGHFAMFNYMLETVDLPLSEDLIKQYHFKLKAGVFEDLANGYPVGEYKNRRNIVSNITTALPHEVPEKMQALLEEYEQSGNVELPKIARFHADFEWIHPFQDGNGRVGRMIVFKECLRHDICPAIIMDSQRSHYYHALSDVQQGTYEPLCKLMEESQRQYDQAIREFLPPHSDPVDQSEEERKAIQEFFEREKRIRNAVPETNQKNRPAETKHKRR